MPKFHITSLLRPRGHYNSIEDQLQLLPGKEQIPTATESASTSNTVETQVVLTTGNSIATISNVEIIPTLNFVDNKPLATYFELPHIATEAVCADSADTDNYNVEERDDDDDENDNDSRHTYTITATTTTTPSDTTTNTDELLLLQQAVNSLSFTETISFFDEPTSSISIEMESLSKTTTTTTSATTDLLPATTTVTSQTSSGNQSIEEDIEEIIEISDDNEEANENNDGELEINELKENSLELSEVSAGSLAKPLIAKAKKQTGATKRHLQLFGIDSDDSESNSVRVSVDKMSSSDGDEFKIDDAQLSGGKLAQHFVLDDDDDDDNEDLNISLPVKKRLKHSQHESFKEYVSQDEQKQTSLINESTAEDISDLMEESNIEVELAQADTKESTSDNEGLDMSMKKCKPDAPLQHKSSLEVEATEHSDKQNVQTVLDLTGASPEHSEKDHSVDEVVESNHSINMSFDDRDVSSLNPSFLHNNQTLLNRLLEDTMEMEEMSLKSSANGAKINHELVLTQDDAAIDAIEQEAQYSESTIPISSRIITDLDDNRNEAIGNEHKAIEQFVENSPLVETLEMPLNEAKIIDTKHASLQEIIQLQESTLTTEILQLKTPENVANTTHSTVLSVIEVPKFKELNLEQDGKDEEEEENSMELMKLRILAMRLETKELTPNSPTEVSSGVAEQMIKQMERIPLSEYSKDVLEDITEESERNSLSTAEEQQSISLEKSISVATAKSEKTLHAEFVVDNSADVSIVSLNMIRMLEHKVGELEDMLASKDACLASLNLQLETSLQKRRGSNGANSTEQPYSGRESTSVMTNSTEYRTFAEDFGGPTMDIYMELSKRDELIAKLTDSLQQSMTIRENLQAEGEKLSTEVQMLRKQLIEAMETLRRPYWPRDQESNGQRISEISMDLISESDDDLERQFLTDNEDKYSRNSRERQLSIPRLTEDIENVNNEWTQAAFSKQIEQFQKYLTPSEVRLFFMVQKKFDDFLSQELEKCKMKSEQELKVLMDQWETEKLEKSMEIKRLQTLHEQKEQQHTKEMEDLRKYFENKCADLERQFSDDVFSQKSQKQSNDSTSSECSDQEKQMPEEIVPLSTTLALALRSKETSPRKRTRAQLLLSPSHRQMTPCADVFSMGDDANLSLELTELKGFYTNKLHELQRTHDQQLRKLHDRVKYYENRYPDDDFMATTKQTTEKIANKITSVTNTSNNNNNINSNNSKTAAQQPNSITQHVCDANTSLIIIDQDELNINDNNESQVIQKIIEEYERRLQEQLILAREDIVHELEHQIQTLLSEGTTDDQHWPPELILLREKFTAKSQLEIAQLQIKHEEEMSRKKLEYEKQLNRKIKRNLTFDSARDYEQLISERDGLLELSKTFHHVLVKVVKCVANCENDLNATLVDQVQRLLANRSLEEDEEQREHILNNTSLLNASQMRLVPDVHSLLEVVEDPSLVQYINQKSGDLTTDDFDLNECLERLKLEAGYLLELSEGLHNDRKRLSSESSGAEKNDSCCEAEDGLKIQNYQKHANTFLRTNSLNEQQLGSYNTRKISPEQLLTSLPPNLSHVSGQNSGQYSTPGGNASELNFQVHELKNRLIKSETDRINLQKELEHTITRNAALGQELQSLRDQFSQLNSLNNTDYAEGYGLGSLKSPRLSATDKSSASFAQLQEKARNILSTPTQQQSNNDATVILLQMIEDFCREGDKVVECNKKDREDLQSQVDTADKQLKATRQFLEEQAAEREQERDEFVREIERLKLQIRDKEKERSSFENASKELEHLESQIRDLTQKLNETNAKRDKFELELKASIDKIFVLREIITDLETQVETKALNERVQGEKIKQLEEYINSQTRSNETLQSEVQSLKTEIDEGYQERIRALEEKLQNIRPSAEQSMLLNHVIEQLRDIELTLDQKTKTLEFLHQSASSNSGSEDISARGNRPTSLPLAIVTPPQGSPVHPSPREHSLTTEGVQRIIEKLSKHTRVEEAAIKRIQDLEMQVTQMRSTCVELQHERDALQDRMSEQTERISALQSRLEEQRQRAEELNRSGTAGLNIRIHDLQMEVQSVRETLSSRDKQIATTKLQLEKSKTVIDRLEAELAVTQQPDRSLIERLEAELKQKNIEIQKLKDKIKSEMINKLSLPDLMETMLADKNEEIDHLKEQLESKEKELQTVLDSSQASSIGGNVINANAMKDEVSTKLSARTLSDIVSITEFDEPDVVRRVAVNNENTPLLIPGGSGVLLQHTMETSKEAVANLTQKRTEDLSCFTTLHPTNTFDHPHYFQDPNILMASGKSDASLTPGFAPRQINFSTLTEDSKLKTPNLHQTTDIKVQDAAKETIEYLEKEVMELQSKLEELKSEKDRISLEKETELHTMEEDLVATQLRLGGVQEELSQRLQEIVELRTENESTKQLQNEIVAKAEEIEKLLMENEKLTVENKEKSDLLTKNEKNMRNYQDNEEKYTERINEFQIQILKDTEKAVQERDSLRKELRCVSEIHEQCKFTLKDAELRKKEIEQLNQEIKNKDERLLTLNSKLTLGEENTKDLQRRIGLLEREAEILRQQQNSDNSTKQYSVDEIAQQLEKELNYSAQLDSNILKAIESEEENNLDVQHLHKEQQTKAESQGTDDENFTGERELLNQLAVLKEKITLQHEQNEVIRHELLAAKQYSQDIQEQDTAMIEEMRIRLETALNAEDELHKQLDIEREHSDRLQTQLTALQRAESRRNSALLLKSPTESPRKSPRSLSDFETELAERLRSEIKLLTARNERERERFVDLQRGGERERQRFENELHERVDYCEKLKKEMEKLAREKDIAEQEIDHLQERLTLQTQEIESLEARLASLQAAETRRTTRRERQQRDTAEMLAELQEVKTKCLAAEGERESLTKTITQLRFDVERSAHREAKLTEALAYANANSAESSVPQQFMQKMTEINVLLAENAQENRQMTETVQFLVDERRQLQKKCQELESQLGGATTVAELEERSNHIFGRYLRVESHRKALVYQKRYLSLSLRSFQDGEQRVLAVKKWSQILQPQRNKTKLFKTVALAIIAIQRIKYIQRSWRTGKRIVSKSVFTVTPQKRSSTVPTILCAASSSISPILPTPVMYKKSPLKHLERELAPLQSPALLNKYAGDASDVMPQMVLTRTPTTKTNIAFDCSTAQVHQE